MLTWKPNAIIPDRPLRWVLTTLRFYALVAIVGVASAFAVFSILMVLLTANTMVNTQSGQFTILVAMIMMFGAAAYIAGRYSSEKQLYAVYAGFVIIILSLLMFGLFSWS
jgi:hypothetical protein